MKTIKIAKIKTTRTTLGNFGFSILTEDGETFQTVPNAYTPGQNTLNPPAALDVIQIEVAKNGRHILSMNY